MPKYKYVDGVKYRVVPQSVLGYALVREDSDNSLPAGGTEGQVLAKASDTDYDVEWATVESGGANSDVFVIDIYVDDDTGYILLVDDTKLTEYYNNLEAGMIPVIKDSSTSDNAIYTTTAVEKETGDETNYYSIKAQKLTILSVGVSEDTYTVGITNEEYEITESYSSYPSVG